LFVFSCFKVEKPDKVAFEAELKELTDAIDALKDARAKTQEKIELTMSTSESKSETQVARTKLNELKAAKNALINEKKVMKDQLDSASNENDKLLNEKKAARSNMRFGSVEEIDKEIKALQHKQETTSMSLNEEKKLLKDIEGLKVSKRFVDGLKSTDASILDVKEQKKIIKQKIAAKDKEIDEYSKQIKDITETLKSLNEKDTSKKDAIGVLFKERDELRKEMTAKIAEKDAVRAAFREKNDAFYLNQRAVRRQKQLQYEEEKRKRDEADAEYQAKIEAEEAKKIPYEEEQGLCEFLANYLERTYLSTEEEKGEETKKPDTVEVKDDPFAGMKAVGKNDEEEYFGKGKGKKKRVRQGKKQDSIASTFTLSVDTFEQFGMIQMTPPISIDEVADSVKALREKKEWYKNQPRGSVPTATEIRKAAAAKLRQEENGNTGGAGGGKANNNKGRGGKGNNNSNPKKDSPAFALSNDDFVPLGAGTAASSTTTFPIYSTWGKGSSTQATISDEAPTPAEAAAANTAVDEE
jgi:uncharacterized coiled-coil DUF342 family protein